MNLAQKMEHLSQHKLFKNGVNCHRLTLKNLYSDFGAIHKSQKGMKRNPEDMKPADKRAKILQSLRQSTTKKFSTLSDDQLLYVTDP